MGKEFRTDLSKAKGLGSAKEGAGHWLYQRVTALGLIPLTIWFTVIVLQLCRSNFQNTSLILKSPFNLICFILFIGFSIYHGLIGMQVIIEDYVHTKLLKRLLLILLYLGSIVTIVAVLCALLIFHISTFYLA